MLYDASFDVIWPINSIHFRRLCNKRNEVVDSTLIRACQIPIRTVKPACIQRRCHITALQKQVRVV